VSAMPPVVIIGAGPAGLAAAAALRRAGTESVIFERGPAVAASWRDRHEDLRLNTVRWLSDLPGLRIPRADGRWPSRDAYIRYLERFAAAHRADIRFGTHVQRLEPADGGWTVLHSAGGCETSQVETGQVIVAAGHDRVPWLPDWATDRRSSIPVLHVSGLRRAADLAGLRVLLIGAGNSGVEIAGRLADAGVARLWVSVRTPPCILPRELAGVPLHPLSVAMRGLPERARDAAALLCARLAFGDLTRHGLPAPPTGPYARLRRDGVTVAIDDGFVAHLKAGRLEIVGVVESLSGAQAVLAGGRRLDPDIVLAATGFRRGLEPLVGHLGVLGPRGLPAAAPPAAAAPGLWFAGYRIAIEGNLRLYPAEARKIARAIAKG
jgi:putative flavoprotein involved in K+ transport